MSDDPLDLDTGLPTRIAADAAVLAPLTLSVARRLPASADAEGVMWPDLSALARELRTKVSTIEEAIAQLRRRGHLIVEPRPDLRAATKAKRAAGPGDTRQLDLFAHVVRALTCRPRGLVGYRFAGAPTATLAAARRTVPTQPRPRARAPSRGEHGAHEQAERPALFAPHDARLCRRAARSRHR